MKGKAMRIQSRESKVSGATAVGLTALIALSGCTGTATTPGAASSSQAGAVASIESNGDTYVVPSTLTGQRGRLLGAKMVEFEQDEIGAERQTILYESRNSNGAPVAVSGTVLIPKGTPPAGGWPIVSWAHGTTGVADRCAPSHRPDMGYPTYSQYLARLVASGYAVVATDYIGLGTPGMHTYMNAVDQGNAVDDIVPAARALDSRLSDRWFVSGHSQGGAAALESVWTGTERSGSAPSATISLAPGNDLGPSVRRFVAGGDTYPARAAYMMFVLTGMQTTDPTGGVDQLLSDEGKRFKEKMSTACLFDDSVSMTDIPDQRAMFSAPQDSPVWDTFARRADEYGNPDQKPVSGPALVITGDADLDVPTAGTRALVENLRSKKSDIAEIVVPGEEHEKPLNSTFCAQLKFLASHGGARQSATCTAS